MSDDKDASEALVPDPEETPDTPGFDENSTGNGPSGNSPGAAEGTNPSMYIGGGGESDGGGSTGDRGGASYGGGSSRG